MTTAKPLTELIDPSWARALAPVEPMIHEIGERLREEVLADAGRSILDGIDPPQRDTETTARLRRALDDVDQLVAKAPARRVLTMTFSATMKAE